KLTNKKAVELAGMKAMAIVPILNHAGEAIGTIHVEREDNLEPPKEEIEDLMSFGRSLATAIEQAERVNLLQTTLDKIPTPVAIGNALEKFRYANRAAAEMLNVDNRWQERDEYSTALSEVQPVIAAAAREAISNGQTVRPLSEGKYISYVMSD